MDVRGTYYASVLLWLIFCAYVACAPLVALFRCLKTDTVFDRRDEDELVMATSECLDGMCFLASK